ncbi:MAG: hypothetical protein L6R43_00625 [Planctomycetes bacterium]|nr:hypothetical protein [Planctomycetota bacterium]
MSPKQEKPADEPDGGSPPHIAKLFEHHLNRSGHPFQQAVLRRAETLWKQKSPWMHQVSEYPVEVSGAQTRIDIVFGVWSDAVGGFIKYLVAECKRVDPAVGRWLFARAPLVRRNGDPKAILVETLQRFDTGAHHRGICAGFRTLHSSDDIYHVAMEARTEEKGDGTGTRSGAVEDAATQVMRGLNGLIEGIAQDPEVLPIHRDITLVPVVFTTAELWATETDLAEAELSTGRVSVSEAHVRCRKWLWYQYHPSPSLRHSVKRYFAPSGSPRWQEGLAPHLDREFARAIAVVGPDGIDDFLQSSIWGC